MGSPESHVPGERGKLLRLAGLSTENWRPEAHSAEPKVIATGGGGRR